MSDIHQSFAVGADGQDRKEKNKDQDYYFNFYASLQNQANMISDISRTATYRKAILGNARPAFVGKTVLDVGAGSGILSYLSAQAGADMVIALEASSMADKIQILLDHAAKTGSNPHIAGKVRIVRGMVESAEVQRDVLRDGKVDTIVSEPIGVMLLHERMVESFLLARDLFLKPGGTLLPSAGHIFFCPFTDEALHQETTQKAQFFNQTLFGTDFSALYDAARVEVFAQPVVGMFPPASLLAAACAPKTFDFYRCANDDLLEFSVPVDFIANRTSVMHGLASWFDLDFYPHESALPARADTADDVARAHAWDYAVVGPQPVWTWTSAGETPLNPGPTPEPGDKGVRCTLGTGPNGMSPARQARLLLPEPLAINRAERVVGSVHFKVNDARSYDLVLELVVDRPGASADAQLREGRDGRNPLYRRASWNLAQQTFNYSYTGETALAI
ncbi:hypothetical protein Q5752_005462 [Cryptotrichosporon argae]